MEKERPKPKLKICSICKGKGTDPKKRSRKCPNRLCNGGQVPEIKLCDCPCHTAEIDVIHMMPCCDFSYMKEKEII